MCGTVIILLSSLRAKKTKATMRRPTRVSMTNAPAPASTLFSSNLVFTHFTSGNMVAHRTDWFDGDGATGEEKVPTRTLKWLTCLATC